ncbi:hypothetical protein FDT66_11865 [Polaribacter aestuariivivens]|uniref:endo-1,4-beta-xylanase n=1 Tax=Polaribacter aestuariivivens TaxID=2304626 RepID=A0A5S3N208_9FLAO|nr:endo-1,4-beta-xylanase [Polaribacter aestuariivivens]TMM29077.1 hypothetical protein FDT66_11865 [Polaribacter aestuariivivens]
MKNTILVLFIFLTSLIYAQKTPTGENLVDYDQLKYIKSKGKGSAVSTQEDSTFLIETKEQPKFIYNFASSIPLQKKSYKKDRVFLLSYKAKTEISSLETGEAKILWLFRQSNSYKDNITITQSLSSEWQTYYMPFQTTKYVSKEELALVMQFGFRPQSFLIKDIKFEVFKEGTDINRLPKTKITYDGIAPDAKWRKDALGRIEAIRKGNFSVEIYRDGKPLKNKTIKVQLVKHHFGFGGALDAKNVVSNSLDYQKFKTAFDLVVLANDLKIKRWNDKQKEQTLKALEILNKDHIEVKGHVLIWPGFNYLTPEIKKNKNNPEKVKSIMAGHLDNILKETKGMVSHWDVVNEAYTNKDLQKITGSEDILYSGFIKLAKEYPNIERFTNEYGIISKGGIDTKKQQWYYDFIKRIDENTNNAVQGIGIQSHIGTDLTPPERVLEILSFYAGLGKKIGISEFTMDVQDPEIREQYTKDFMIAAFSHPNVSEFLFWGSTDDERKKVDIFTPEGEIGVMGKAYFSLVHDAWKTNLNGITNQNGIFTERGFYGTYKYSFVDEGILQTGTFELKPRAASKFKIEI